MSKVINIFEAKRLKDKEKEEAKKNEEGESFEEIMRKNEENKRRLEKERSRANKSTLRSYRIKN